MLQECVKIARQDLGAENSQDLSRIFSWAVCGHLVAYSNLNDLNLFGKAYSKPVKPVLEKFISRNKKGAKKKVGAPKKVTNCLERE